jgi:DNA helicase-2/ATP-dependent DNA helicase PcrA
VSDYGLRLGIERDVVLLGGAQSWQLASEVVEAYDGDYEHFTAPSPHSSTPSSSWRGSAPSTSRIPAEVRDWVLERVETFEALPYVAAARKNPTQAASELAAMFRTRASVADMVVRYQEAKTQRGVLDFGDLVALAARIASDIPLAAVTERPRYKVVLLDEFQDTSHAQLVLFSRLFGQGHAVTAVGDPNQSIYGFRGASAGQLFPLRTGVSGAARGPSGDTESYTVAPTSYLTTAWRNGRNILEAANTIAAPLNRAAAASDGPAGEKGQRQRLSPCAGPQPRRGGWQGGDRPVWHG